MGQLCDEHPLLTLVSGLITGCLIGINLQIQAPMWSLLGLLVLLIVAVGVRTKAVFAVVLWFFCVTWAVFAVEPFHASRSVAQTLGVAPLDGMQVVEGTVVRRPVTLPQGQRFELHLERIVMAGGEIAVDGRLLVTIAKGEGSWLSGDRIRLRGSLRKPRRLGLPGEFDYPRYLRLHRIDATFWVADARQVLLMRAAAVSSWQRLLDGAAYRCDQLIRNAVPDPDTAAVVMALVTGSQSALSPELKAAYARAGVSHILSISGFHVAVIAATLAQLLQWVGLRWQWLALRFNVRQVALLATLPAMIGYLVFTGAAPATTRSVIMLAAVLLALWAERESQVLDALLLAAFLLLVYDPVVLFDISFQLSFLSLWGIVVLTPLLVYPFKDRLSGWRRQLALFFAASLAAILATAVPTLVTFHQASFTGLLANLVVVPLLGYGAVIIGAGAAMSAVVAPSLASALFGLAGWLVAISNRFVVWVADLPLVRS
ncbi:MAG: ComEC/Rec2 family competence protein, partial [Geobacter sp.]